MTSKNPFVKGKQIDLEAINNWMEANGDWLTEWLTNVVIIDQKEVDDRVFIFQTFRSIIKQPGPIGIWQAGQSIKAKIMLQAIFGHQVEREKRFSGFLNRVGRMPEKGDIGLFTALKWFKLETFSPSGIILANNSPNQQPCLTTICAVDFILRTKEEKGNGRMD